MKLPDFAGRIVALLPDALRRLVLEHRSLLIGSTAATVGLSAALAQPLQPPAEPLVPSEAIAIVNRDRKTPKLVLKLKQHVLKLVAQHRSHSSHSSHRSHSSHYSGSGGGGGGTGTTVAPVYSAPTPQPTASPEAAEPSVEVTVDAIDAQQRSFKAHDAFGSTYEFAYRDDTMLHYGSKLAIRLDALLDSGETVPLRTGGKVKVEWKASADGKKRIAKRLKFQ